MQAKQSIHHERMTANGRWIKSWYLRIYLRDGLMTIKIKGFW